MSPANSAASLKGVLIFPPSLYKNYAMPVNLAAIGAVWKNKGVEVQVIDASAVNNDISLDEIVDQVGQIKPDIVGITMNALFLKPAYEVAQKLKPLGIPVVAGGPHPSIVPMEAVENGCDISVYGEGEITSAELIDWLRGQRELKDIDGIAWRSKGKVVLNRERDLINDLDELPFPAKDIFVREHYTVDSDYYQVRGGLFTSRGCPAKCTYCNLSVFTRKVRTRSAQNLYQEMKWLNKEFGVTAFEFLDDTFCCSFPRVEELCELIINDPDFEDIHWQCNNRVDFTKPDLLEKMRDAGCFRLFYGIESGDEETLAKVQKKQHVEAAIQTLKWTHELGMLSICGMMFGFPWDTPKHVNNTLNFMRRVSPYVNEFNPLGVLVPVPGTGIYHEYCENTDMKEWWLKDQYGHLYRSNTYFPYFRRRFYNDFSLLDDGFFTFTPATKRAIRKATSFIGRHNITTNNSPLKAAAVLGLVYVSKALYKIHPELERFAFNMVDRVKSFLRRGGRHRMNFERIEEDTLAKAHC